MQIRFCDDVEKQVSVAEESIRVFPLIRLYDPIGDAIHQILRFLALIHEDELIDQFKGVEIVLRHHTLTLEHQMEPWRWVRHDCRFDVIVDFASFSLEFLLLLQCVFV